MGASAYIRAGSLDEALAALAVGDCTVIAGGTDVMVKARGRDVFGDRRVLDVSAIPALRRIDDQGPELAIGGAVTLAQLVSSATVREKAPLLARASSRVGSAQIRNRATIAGNVVNACPAADCIPALVALGARVRLRSAEGARDLPVCDVFRPTPACLKHEGMRVRTCFFADPVAKKTTLAPGELVECVLVPVAGYDERCLFSKLTASEHVGLGIMSVAATLRVGADCRVSHVRASMGGLFSAPCVLDEATAPLIGVDPADAPALEAALAAASDALADKLANESPQLADYAYKARVAPALLADVLRALATNTPLDDGSRP